MQRLSRVLAILVILGVLLLPAPTYADLIPGNNDTGMRDGTTDSDVNGVAIQLDGKIVIGGQFNIAAGVSRNFISRLNSDGTDDPSFMNGLPGFDDAVSTVALQPDGKILVGGMFSAVNASTRSRIARLNPNGSVDTGFQEGMTGADGEVVAIAVQPDGKVLIGGTFATVNGVARSGITRLNSDGSLDPSFNNGTGLAVGAGFAIVRSILVLPDGKVLVGGRFDTVNGVARPNLARLNPDGSVDSGFDAGFITGIGAVHSIARQPDTKIVIGGDFNSVGVSSRQRIARLTVTGTVDSAFDTSIAFDGIVRSVLVLPDGKVLAGGEFTRFAGTERYRLARLMSDGTLDNGALHQNAGPDGPVSVLVEQFDGKVVAGGQFLTIDGFAQRNLARLHRDGSVDVGFWQGMHGANNDVWAIGRQSSGKIILAGEFGLVYGIQRNRIVRLNTDGTVDLTFLANLTGTNARIYGLAVQSDDKIVIVGDFTRVNGTDVGYIARLNADGTRDTGFAVGLAGANNAVRAVVVQPDGKILIGGDFTNVHGSTRNRIARLNSDGTLDTFQNGLTGANFPVMAIALDASANVLIGGVFTSVNGTARSRIAKLTSTGALDGTFQNLLAGADNVVQAVAIDGSNVVIGGFFQNVNATARKRVARLDGTTGALDGTFADPNVNGGVRSLAIQAGNKVVIGGDFGLIGATGRARVARLNGDGTLDGTFAATGAGANDMVRTVFLPGDGTVFLGGAFTLVGGESRGRHAKLDSSGLIDLSFKSNLGADDVVRAAALAADDRIVIGGDFTRMHGVTRNRIARLRANGALDLSFDAGTGPDNQVLALAVQADGKPIIGGGFGTVAGTGRGQIARLNLDGTLDTGFSGPGLGADGRVRTIVLSNNDQLVTIGGDFMNVDSTPRSRLAQLTSTGLLNGSFAPNPGPDSIVNAIVARPNGTFVIGGEFANVDGVARSRIAGVLASGALDPGFDPGTGVAGAMGYVAGLARQPDGKIVLAGSFQTVNGVTQNNVGRLNADGSVDGLFLNGLSGTDTTINAVAVQPDGGILIGGEFTDVNGTPRLGLARLLPSGALDTGFLNAAPNGIVGTALVLAVQRDGKALLAGNFKEVQGELRLQAGRVNAATPPTGFTPSPVIGTAGLGYSHTVTATGNPAPAFAVVGGALPPGIQLLASGVLTGTPLQAGSYPVTFAAHNGIAPVLTATTQIAIAKAAATVTITSDLPDPSFVGQPVTITFQVLPQNPANILTPTGTVTVTDGSQSCTASLATGACKIAFSSTGAHPLSATYGGDGNFSGASSAAAPHQVNQASTTTAITGHLPSPSTVSQTVTITFSVTGQAGSIGTPTGTVTVTVGAQSCQATVAAGSCTITFTSPATLTLTASYGGDATFLPSTSAPVEHVITATPAPQPTGKVVTLPAISKNRTIP